MTINVVRRKLRNIRNIRRELKVIAEQIEELRVRAESSGGFSEEFHASTGLVVSKVANCVEQIMDQEEKLNNKKLALVNAEKNAEDLLENLNESESGMRAVLRTIYILCKTQEQAAELLHYSDRQIRYLEFKGVKLIAQRSG